MSSETGDDAGPSALYSIQEPLDTLEPFVRRVLIADAPVGDGYRVRAAPTGYNYIGWHVSGRACVSVDGVSTKPDEFHLSGQLRGTQAEVLHSGHVRHILAEFTATGLSRLLHVPGSAIFGRTAPVAELAPACARRLAALREAPHAALEARAAAFQNVLASFADEAAAPIDYLEKTVAIIENASGVIRITDLCRRLGVSQRHLSRRFREVVGIGPKYFAKVIQLNTALGVLLSGDQARVAKAAHDCGYSDQAHFVHVMQELLRVGPTAFLESDDDVLATFLAKSQAERTS